MIGISAIIMVKFDFKAVAVVFMLVLLVTFLFTQAEKLGVQAVSSKGGYASRLFDTSTVHTIDIVMDDWDDFIKNIFVLQTNFQV